MNGSSLLDYHAPAFTVYSRFLPANTDTKHVVVLLPAFPFTTEMWEPMTQALRSIRSDTALLLVDFPGFGKSTLRAQWDFSSFSLELRNVIEQHTRRAVVLCGLSMGGYAALECYRLNVDIIKAMVLSNTRAQSDSEKEKDDRAVFAEEILGSGSEAILKKNYPNFVTEKTPADIADGIRNGIFGANSAAAAAAQLTMSRRRDSTDLLPHISVPTLVIASEYDRITRSTVIRKMAKAIPRSSFVEIGDAAHLSVVEKPKAWAETLSAFLDTLG